MKDKNKKNQILQYLQDYRFNSILVKNFALIFISLFTILFGVTFIVSHTMNDIIAQEVGNMSINSLSKTGERIDTVMEESMRISGKLSLDDDVQLFLLSTETDQLRNNLINKVREKIKMYSGVFNYIDTIYVYSHKRKYIVSNMDSETLYKYEDLSWYHNFVERENEPPRMIVRLKKDTYPFLISYMQPIRLSQMQFLGGIIVNIDVEKLEDVVTTSGDGMLDNLLIVDSRKNIIFSTDHDLLMKKITKVDFYKDINMKDSDGYMIMNDGEKDQLVTMISSTNNNWKYISTIPLSNFKEYNDRMKGFYIRLLIFSGIAALVTSVFLSLHSYDPVKEILSLVKDPNLLAENKEWEKGLKKDERKEIAFNIVHNLYSNQQLQKEIKSYVMMVDKAQVTALQAQINPHFLYNTLENIRWMAMDIYQGDNLVSQNILNLSELLRLSLDNDQQIITIEEEIKNTKLYIEILQLRYQDKLQVFWEIGEGVLICPIVKVSFQPIIENAIYHGIKPLRRKGIITITIYKTNSKVVAEIKDNGVGMETEKINNLNTNMREKHLLKGEHIGICNVNQRLKLILGDMYGLEIQGQENQGTTVIFHLPLCNE